MSSGRNAAVAAAITLAVAGPANAGSEPPSSVQRDDLVAARSEPTPASSPTRRGAESAVSASAVSENAVGEGNVAEKNGKPKPVSCIAFWGEAKYVVGYNHIVHINNACAYDAVCSVHTDVNPTPQTVTAPQKQETLVVTFLGSPVGRFVPFVDCVATP